MANVANLTKRINLINNSEEDSVRDSFSGDYSEYFPQLIWVLRDFSLDKGDKSPKYILSLFNIFIIIFKMLIDQNISLKKKVYYN